MSCLGERLTALVDGELGHEERDRALAHLAICIRCRSEADTLRRLKKRLRGLGDLPASDGANDLPSTDFMTRLRDLANPEGVTDGGAVTPPPPDFLARLRGLAKPPGTTKPEGVTGGAADDLPSPDFVARLRDLADAEGVTDDPSSPDFPARLRGLAGPEGLADGGAVDVPSPDLLARLRGLAGPEGVADGGAVGDPAGVAVGAGSSVGSAGEGGSGRRVPVASPLSARPRDNRPAGRAGSRAAGVRGNAPKRAAFGYAGAVAVPRQPRRRYLAVGAATLVLGLGAASYAAGGQREAPAVSPAFDRFAVEHALTSGDVPTTDPVDDHAVVPPAPEP